MSGFEQLGHGAKEGYIILFHGVEEWEWFTGSEKEAIDHATKEVRRLLNYGRKGFTVIWRAQSPHVH